MDFRKELIEKFEKYNLHITDDQIEQFHIFYEMLVEWNEKMNLTAITEQSEVIVKHFIDSVLPYEDIPECSKVIDIGAGAGFPSIPLKILRPDISITMLDSLNKRVVFLQNVVKELKLSNIECVHGRSEDYANKQDYREKYDVVIARAVARLNTLLEYCVPFVAVNGKFLAYKSLDADDEIVESKKAMQVLGVKNKAIRQFRLQEYDLDRKVLVFEKTKSTPSKYPRNQNKPKTQPIV